MNLRIKKGLDLHLQGAVQAPDAVQVEALQCAIVPDDFPGFQPKVLVREGDAVEAGAPLMRDKNSPSIALTSPISGKVVAIVRGERRKVLRVVVSNDGKHTERTFDTKQPLIELLGASGLLAHLRRRPYDVIVRPEVRPRDIFVTAIDSAPLSAGMYLPHDAADALAAAVKALRTLTDGKIYISHRADWTGAPVPGAEMVTVDGPHPAGNVGVQIANIAPVNKGETVWTMDVTTLWRIGRLLLSGKVDYSTLVAVTGPEVNAPVMVKTTIGCEIKGVLAGRLPNVDHHIRIISGNVLTGVAVNEADGFLQAPYRQVTVIAEGDDNVEFMGWASIAPSKMSAHKALPLRWWRKLFAPDARINGGRRAMIFYGEYDRVLPMDIVSEYLLKAIISRNIDDMEALGVYEIAPEDFALCEYIDTSKMPLQQIVRNGLDYLRKELE
ncbi:MAG: Na(+)-translocating NADH-quinone reductase subunit A [Muribaculaceae bacterium]